MMGVKMEFRKILYLKNKDINLTNCIISREAKPHLELSEPETPMVLRILVNERNIVVIEFAKPISIEHIREATQIQNKEKSDG